MPPRAKGRLPRTVVDAGWPYQVVLDVPERGFGRHLETILAWLYDHAPAPQHCRGGGPAGLDAARWAFRDFERALAFQARFGGRLTDAGEENPRSLKLRSSDAKPMREILAAQEMTEFSTDPD